MSLRLQTITEGEVGRQLLHALDQQRLLRSMSRRELAEQLGISPPYLSQLFNGDKPVSALPMACLRRCAEFLQQPMVRCLVLSGHLSSADFFRDAYSELDAVQDALAIVACSRWGEVAQVNKAQLLDLPRPVQWLLIRLYESAAQKCLFRNLPAACPGVTLPPR